MKEPVRRWGRKLMLHRRGTTTDNFLNIIQVIELGRKTGYLLVERGEGTAREEGELVFVRGQIIEANSGHLVGQQALNWLKTWGVCHFLFVPSPFSARPLRTQPNDTGIQLLNQKRFSRLHLHLFLLVDGQRNIIELARIIGKKPEEVQQLLSDMEAIGIIQQ
jgi:hypothetical protein